LIDDASDVHLVAEQDPDDFFFVTDRMVYNDLKELGFNCVLQNNEKVTDDGSLSVYCGTRNICYVNVEAQHGHLEQQVAMLRALVGVLADRSVRSAARGSSTKIGTKDDQGRLDLVNLALVDPSLVIEARYATADNLTGQPLYPRNELYLERTAADRLSRAQSRLRKLGYGLKVLDAYRPLSVQKQLWKVVPDPKYVADPAKGSRHNRGCAVDVTLVGPDGKEVEMPTEFDEFSERAHRDFQDLSAAALRHRKILEDVMVHEGFIPLATEWWHFDAPGWEQFPVSDLDPYGDGSTQD
jgi:D-alanyl-D-alanine dipeptidase